MSWYDELDQHDKGVVNNHTRLYGKIKKLFKINNHLINEFHNKKGNKKRKLYTVSDEKSNKYYKYYMFIGQKAVGDFNSWPDDFRCYLEDAMYKEMHCTTSRDLLNIYYGRDTPERICYMMFDENEWMLDQCPEMTSHDIDIMEKYRVALLSLVGECIEIVATYCSIDKTNLLQKERNRIVKAMDKVN